MAATIIPNSTHFQANNHLHNLSFTLQSCSSLSQAKQIHACILRNNLDEHFYAKLLLFCTTTAMSSTSNALDYALLVFEQLQQEPNIFMWNTMIRGYANSNYPMRAVRLYIRMRDRGMLPNNYTFTFLIKACTAMSCLVNCYSLGPAVHAQTIVFGIPDSDVHVYTSLLNISGDFDVAGKLFNYMPIKTLPTWNAMIAGYAQSSRPSEALALFYQMQLAGVRPDEITVVSILPSCAQLGALELGEWVHLYVKRNKFDNNTTVCNAIIDMYAKCGCIDKAMDVFKGMRDRTVVTWNTLISGLAIHGQAEEAIALFTKMETKGVMPDAITFVGLLNACAHAGSVDKAWTYFKDMQMVYGIQPKIEHYGCMVDVLGRTRHLNEALGLIDSMPLEPNSVVLGSLLSACRICNDSELGEKVLERLMQLEPLNPGYYVLLSNMYASSGRWEDVTRVRNLMKSRGIGKTPGCSSIEMNNTVHEFVVGDKTHPQAQEIYRKLDEISLRLESAGYVPDTSIVLFDLDEEEKAQNLSVHSEKLAVAFALLNTCTVKPIRVVKNLRVCRDCHLAIKLISKEYGREIVLRDCNRFHHFKDGVCSCKEFW
ncbi:hypothetical protein AQUCO_04200153v1 [Aquilegia coerulea]|uniref:DYW domain-containing protein n=1 Tax=Aquilegia coerulea TaxID=218851 RepID=A0A2G5CPI9_AQUCA|nr:hypothetical protein AQUCO_04200153v1 [Aquilegia coerulea]